ncbi:MAG: hypothetical protein RLZZ299_566 [Pseudomonadota bacterium]
MDATAPAEPAAPSARGELRALWDSRALLWALTWNDLRARYTGSAVGFLWTVLVPVLELVVYTFVFHVLIGVRYHPTGGAGHYVLFLFCAIVCWHAFADGLVQATTSIRTHAHLVRKLNFPTIVLPAHHVASAVVNQCIRLVVLLLAVLVFGPGWSPWLLLVPFFVVVQAALTLGLGLLFSTVSVYLRDTMHWVNAALMLGVFVTPVFYPASEYPRAFRLLLYPNPMAQLVGIHQGLVLNQHLPHPNSMLWACVLALLSLLVGASVFAHNRRAFADLA